MNERFPLCRIAVLSGLILAGFGAPAGAVYMSVFPDTRTVAPGASFQVEVRATDIPSQEVLTFFGLMVGYDATVLEPRSVGFSDALGVEALGESFNDSVLDANPNEVPGNSGLAGYTGSFTRAVELANYTDSFALDPSTVTGTQTDFDYLQGRQSPAPVTLVTIEFQLSIDAPAGRYPLGLITDADFTDPLSGGFFDLKGREFFNILSSTTEDGEVVVSVPLPATATLLTAGLLLLGRRRLGS
jgi:hypothetical protein